MNNITYTSYSASPYWRWRNEVPVRLYLHLLLTRENHDILKSISKLF